MHTKPIPSPTAPDPTPTGCCPPFDPTRWDGKEIVWDHKLFLKDHVASFLHVPLNMGKRITKDVGLIEAAHAQPEHRLMLSDDSSPWGSELLIEITRPVPGAEVQPLSGTFLTRVFEGPYSNMGKWAEQMKDTVDAKDLELEKLYFGYVMCPSCAKEYGKNYVVAFAKVKEPLTA